MSNSLDLLARRLVEMHKANANPPSTAPRIGVVITSTPLKIRWGDQIHITEDKLYVPKLYREGIKIPNRYKNIDGSMVDEMILWKIALKPGDQVLIMPDENLRQWYVIDALT
ncbi:DUF2577 domain-containing protein [Paenibacillus gansuensis]|uniref:DUF2577 domain-containing protein n=1 Tax=Paenibacillus gansuensis TaxID=306542 RepID=A0ABW5PKA4_9BACL